MRERERETKRVKEREREVRADSKRNELRMKNNVC